MKRSSSLPSGCWTTSKRLKNAWKRKNDEGYEKATQEMEAGEALLLNRQKMIKLADRSELGWSVVEEYEADELADNSEDEKKIARAEKEAERKAIKRKKRFADGQSTEERQPQRSVHHSTPRLGPCFGCGEVGHIAPNWYPCLNLPWLLNSMAICAVEICWIWLNVMHGWHGAWMAWCMHGMVHAWVVQRVLLRVAPVKVERKCQRSSRPVWAALHGLAVLKCSSAIVHTWRLQESWGESGLVLPFLWISSAGGVHNGRCTNIYWKNENMHGRAYGVGSYSSDLLPGLVGYVNLMS